MRQLWALSGFLGLPKDWDFLRTAKLPVSNIVGYDIFQATPPSKGLWKWAEQFNEEVAKDGSSPSRALLGYSLGGRLALHALVSNPLLWDYAVIISAHPGFSSQPEKELRLQVDKEWSVRFEGTGWNPLMQEWNRREVFQGGSFCFDRLEQDYSRKALADALSYWSVGHQEDLRKIIKSLSLPILWIVGERDIKYSSIAREMSFANPQSRIWIAPQAGHRVPWEQPAAFIEQLTKFLSEAGVAKLPLKLTKIKEKI